MRNSIDGYCEAKRGRREDCRKELGEVTGQLEEVEDGREDALHAA